MEKTFKHNLKGKYLRTVQPSARLGEVCFDVYLFEGKEIKFFYQLVEDELKIAPFKVVPINEEQDGKES